MNHKKLAVSIQGLSVSYGGVEALKSIDIEVKEGEIVALLGANGAGKTTTLRTISGLVAPRAGKIFYYDQDISAMEAEKITSLGIAQSPEGRQVFRSFTVEENLKIGAFTIKNKRKFKRTLKRSILIFLYLRKEKTKWLQHYLVVNNKCWPSQGPSWAVPKSYF